MYCMSTIIDWMIVNQPTMTQDLENLLSNDMMKSGVAE